jgi:hypothetical protein
MRPPWRDAPPDQVTKARLWAIAAFAAPWVMMAAAIVLGVVGGGSTGWFAAGVVLFMLAGLIDLVGVSIAFTAKNLMVRSAAYGAFIALLTHLAGGAIGVIVLFGWCISALNNL